VSWDIWALNLVIFVSIAMLLGRTAILAVKARSASGARCRRF
jgi:hypothetical protein